MEANFEGGQGPEGAVVPWMDEWMEYYHPPPQKKRKDDKVYLQIISQVFNAEILQVFAFWARIAQSVWRLATGWMVRRSSFGEGEIFRARPDGP